jgi:hypothetical protein
MTNNNIRIAGKTTYFLGAGFSAPAGIPVMRGFVTEAFHLLKRYAIPDICIKFAELVNKFRPIAANSSVNIDDIQELFCLVSGSQSGSQAGGATETDCNTLKQVIALTICLAELEDACRMAQLKYGKDANDNHVEILLPEATLKNKQVIKKILRQIGYDDRQNEKYNAWKRHRTVPRRFLFVTDECKFKNPLSNYWYNICVYQAFLSYVIHRNEKGNDAIITPNYDSVLEYVDQSLQSAPQAKISLIKLHGSLHNEPNSEKSLDRRINGKNVSGSHVYQHIEMFNDDLVKISDKAAIDINPPTWDASQMPAQFKELRPEAIKHLQEAERIVIIGYSMPKTDVHTQYMMKHGLDTPDRPKIEIWDIKPKKEIWGTIEEFFGKTVAASVRYESTGLNGFVRSHPQTQF